MAAGVHKDQFYLLSTTAKSATANNTTPLIDAKSLDDNEVKSMITEINTGIHPEIVVAIHHIDVIELVRAISKFAGQDRVKKL